MATGGATRPVRDDWTCTIRRATGAWPGYIAETLFSSTLVPVCTPALAKNLQRLTDFRDATLLVVSHLRHQWPCWFKAAGVETPVRYSGGRWLVRWLRRGARGKFLDRDDRRGNGAARQRGMRS